MEYQLSFRVNEHIYLRDPESSELGKQIVKNAIDLIYDLGFEHFTFKKLAIKMSTTEASIYRYFENKHRLLLYVLNWYWSYMEFLVDFTLQNIQNPKEKLAKIIELFTQSLPESVGKLDYNKFLLNQIVLSESSKVYLIKEVQEINTHQDFSKNVPRLTDVADQKDESFVFNFLYQFVFAALKKD
jgi:AcrR family transcriptional regulator